MTMVTKRGAVSIVCRLLVLGFLALWGMAAPTRAFDDDCFCFYYYRLAYDPDVDQCVVCGQPASNYDCGCGSYCDLDWQSPFQYSCVAIH